MDFPFQNKILDIVTRLEPEYLYLFGSYARNEATSKSDIDLLIKYNYEKTPTLFQIAGVMTDIRELTGMEIQLTDADTASEKFLDRIKPDLIKIYDHSERLV